MTPSDRLRSLVKEATDAPWTWDEDDDLMALWELEPRDGTIVLGFSTGDKPEPADARLIALAPQLAELLADMADEIAMWCEAFPREVEAEDREVLARLAALFPEDSA